MVARILPCFVFTLANLLFCLAVNGQETAVAKNKFAEECKIFAAPVLNATAWQNGDCLVSERVLVDNVTRSENEITGGILLEQRSLVRTAFDYKAKRYANYQYIKLTYTDFDTLIDGRPKEVAKTNWRAGCVDLINRQVWLNDSQAGFRTVELPDDATLATVNPELGFREYRACWWHHGFDLTAFKYCKLSNKFRVTGSGCTSAVTSDDGILDLRFSGTSNITQLIGPFHRYKFDLKSSMPIFFSEHDIVRETKKRLEGPEINLTWKKLNEIYVPRTIVMTRERQSSLINEKTQASQSDREMAFHWFSINAEEPNEALFDGSSVEDINKFLELVDPKKAGADDLAKNKWKTPLTIEKPKRK